MIPYGRQDITQADIEAVVEVLRSDFLTQGPAVPRFEQSGRGPRRGQARRRGQQRHVGAAHRLPGARAGPGRPALDQPDHLRRLGQLRALLRRRGRLRRHRPAHLEPQRAARWPTSWTQAERAGALPKVVVPVHFAGQPRHGSDPGAGQRYGFRRSSRTPRMPSAALPGEPVGNCRFSDITVFSFHPVKIITTGEGGMALTNDARSPSDGAAAQSRHHARCRAIDDRAAPTAAGTTSRELGFNYRMTDMQAALGLSQLGRLDAYVARRNALARRYDAAARRPAAAAAARQPRTTVRPSISTWCACSADARAASTAQSSTACAQRGIGVNLHYIPVHLQPYYRELGFAAGNFPEAEALRARRSACRCIRR